MSITRSLLTALACALVLTMPTFVLPAQARPADGMYTYRDKHGDAPKGFDILSGDIQIADNTLWITLRVRGLKRFGTVQVITDSNFEQNQIFIQNAGEGPYISASWHRSAINIMGGWKYFENCTGGAIRWSPGRVGTISASIPLSTCGVSPASAAASTTPAFLQFYGFGPRRLDVLNAIPGSRNYM